MRGKDLRKRGETSEKYFFRREFNIRTQAQSNFQIQNVDWLSDKYVLLYGLRKWTWRVIRDGIIAANIKVY